MTRLFRRGELKAGILAALAAGGPANGYSVMQSLADRVGGAWQPSPGAVYPALRALEDAGLITGRDAEGTRVYELTDAGRRSHDEAPDVLGDVAARSRSRPRSQPTVGRLLDEMAAGSRVRAVPLAPDEVRAVERVLRRAGEEIERITTVRRR